MVWFVVQLQLGYLVGYKTEAAGGHTNEILDLIFVEKERGGRNSNHSYGPLPKTKNRSKVLPLQVTVKQRVLGTKAVERYLQLTTTGIIKVNPLLLSVR